MSDKPSYWKSTLAEQSEILSIVKKGNVKSVAKSPGSRDVYLVEYGEKQDFNRTSNYSSSCGAGSTKYYADKTGKKPVIFLEGGKTRSESVSIALKNANCDIILIHDGARPYVTEKIISDCIDSVLKNKSAVCAVPVTDTILKVKDNLIVETYERDFLYKAQTPQGFIFKDIFKAYEALSKDENFTDDSQVYLKLFKKIHIFSGIEENVKITYRSDLK